MKTILSALLLTSAAAFLMLSCSEKHTDPEPPVIVEDGPTLGTPFSIQEGESVLLKAQDLRFTFGAVIRDARCPANQECNWPGYADISAWISQGASASIQEMRLIVVGDATPESVDEHKYSLDGYTFRFLALDPQPPLEADDSIYTATVLITFDETPSSLYGPVKIGGLPSLDQALNKPLYFKHFRVVGDTLELSFTVPFTSDRPFFYAFMEPESFSDSWPPSADIHFRNLAQDEVGSAFDTVPARFDLSKVREVYNEQFGQEGPMILNLHSNKLEMTPHYTDDFVRARLVYDPTSVQLNWRPVIVPIPLITVKVHSALRLPIHYFDPNGTELELAHHHWDSGWTFRQNSLVADELQVTLDATGYVSTALIVSDGELADTMELWINVVD